LKRHIDKGSKKGTYIKRPKKVKVMAQEKVEADSVAMKPKREDT
jgi:hypothetical protein